MQEEVIKAGDYLLNVAAVRSAKRERSKLYINLSSGQFFLVEGEAVEPIWRAISLTAIDVMTGEAPARE